MNITVFGAGYVGLVTGVCLAELGNDILCADVDPRKIARLQQGESPIYEPGLAELIRANSESGRLHFSSDLVRGVIHGEILLIAVGTPSSPDGRADLTHVFDVAGVIAEHMSDFKVVINKSTVPVGTGDEVHRRILNALKRRAFECSPEPEFAVVSNPEFLREGCAIEDFMRPDRIIIGLGNAPADRYAGERVKSLYRPFSLNRNRLICMDRRSSELSKYAANAMLATRISFMNEMANLADKLGVDIERVREAIGSDPRIGESFLYPGAGYGGSCFPKDVAALMRVGQDNGVPMRVVTAVAQVNELQPLILLDKLTQRFGSGLDGMRIALWGLAFKPNTDDMREAPSRVIVRSLLERGASVCAYDPAAFEQARHCLRCGFEGQLELLGRLDYADSAMAAAQNADALLILTEWQVFRSPSFEALRQALRKPLIIDGRNLYEPRQMRTLGFEYVAVGRPQGQA